MGGRLIPFILLLMTVSVSQSQPTITQQCETDSDDDFNAIENERETMKEQIKTMKKLTWGVRNGMYIVSRYLSNSISSHTRTAVAESTGILWSLHRARPIIFTARRYAIAQYNAVVVCLSVCMSVHLSVYSPFVRLSHTGIVPKRLDIGSRKQRHAVVALFTEAVGTQFSMPKISAK